MKSVFVFLSLCLVVALAQDETPELQDDPWECPCAHPTGHCEVEGDDTCTCNEGYTGITCAFKQPTVGINDWKCPCENGFCTIANNNKCTCHDGYSGERCEIASECLLHCNFGFCDGLGECHCEYGYGGKFCQYESTDPCVSCINGLCDEEAMPTACDCNAGWEGENCDVAEILIEEASTEQIRHALKEKLKEIDLLHASCNYCPSSNAFCMDNGECGCHQGWTGPDCEEKIPCFHQCDFGWCDQDDVCHCNQGYEGEFCDIKMRDACTSVCENGHCNYLHECVCAWRYSGEFCDVLADDR